MTIKILMDTKKTYKSYVIPMNVCDYNAVADSIGQWKKQDHFGNHFGILKPDL